MIRDAPLLTGRRVLVVEDQYLVADEMRRAVQRLDGEVVGPAPRAESALALVTESPVDLALLDINLGAENVYPLVVELLRVGTPFIFVTGCEPWTIPEAFRDAPRLEKPVTTKALTEAIQQLDAARSQEISR
jgi:DNA-binding NarL/FixJ family response regulator